ncbi:MAG: RNA-binding protein [Solirubrobacterales bacterium]
MDEADPQGEDFTAGDDQPSGPERRCIVTGAVRPKKELLRFVVAPTGEVVPDMDRRLPGRGIWLSPRRDVVNTAVSKRLFAKAARRQVTAAADLADRVEALLVKRCLDAIGLARRAGQAVCGFEKVRAELAGGRTAVLIEAKDAAEGGKDKIRGQARGRGADSQAEPGDAAGTPAGGVPVIELFDGAELGAVFGRDHAVHVAMGPGTLARRLIEEAGLLAGFRDCGSGGTVPPGAKETKSVT